MRRILGVVSVIFIAAVPAAAQDRPVTFNLGGGVTFPMGDVADRRDRVDVQLGGVVNINEIVGFGADSCTTALRLAARPPRPDRRRPR